MENKAIATAIDVAMNLFANLPKLVAAVEQPGHGLAKAELVTGAVTGTLLSLSPEIKDSLHIEEIVDAANSVTGAIVAVNNLTGKFKTSIAGVPAIGIPGEISAPVPPKVNAPTGSVQLPSNPVSVPVPVPTPLPESPTVLRLHIEHMQKRLVDFQSGNAPDKESRIANLTKNIAEAKAKLASLE